MGLRSKLSGSIVLRGPRIRGSVISTTQIVKKYSLKFSNRDRKGSEMRLIRSLGQRWNRFWFEPVSADNLGLWRIILYGSMFLFYLLSPVLFRSWGWHADFSPWGNVSS